MPPGTGWRATLTGIAERYDCPYGTGILPFASSNGTSACHAPLMLNGAPLPGPPRLSVQQTLESSMSTSTVYRSSSSSNLIDFNTPQRARTPLSATSDLMAGPWAAQAPPPTHMALSPTTDQRAVPRSTIPEVRRMDDRLAQARLVRMMSQQPTTGDERTDAVTDVLGAIEMYLRRGQPLDIPALAAVAREAVRRYFGAGEAGPAAGSATSAEDRGMAHGQLPSTSRRSRSAASLLASGPASGSSVHSGIEASHEAGGASAGSAAPPESQTDSEAEQEAHGYTRLPSTSGRSGSSARRVASSPALRASTHSGAAETRSNDRLFSQIFLFAVQQGASGRDPSGTAGTSRAQSPAAAAAGIDPPQRSADEVLAALYQDAQRIFRERDVTQGSAGPGQAPPPHGLGLNIPTEGAQRVIAQRGSSRPPSVPGDTTIVASLHNLLAAIHASQPSVPPSHMESDPDAVLDTDQVEAQAPRSPTLERWLAGGDDRFPGLTPERPAPTVDIPNMPGEEPARQDAGSVPAAGSEAAPSRAPSTTTSRQGFVRSDAGDHSVLDALEQFVQAVDNTSEAALVRPPRSLAANTRSVRFSEPPSRNSTSQESKGDAGGRDASEHGAAATEPAAAVPHEHPGPEASVSHGEMPAAPLPDHEPAEQDRVALSALGIAGTSSRARAEAGGGVPQDPGGPVPGITGREMAEAVASVPAGSGVAEPAPDSPSRLAQASSPPERRVTPLRAVPRGDNPMPPLQRVGRGREPLNPGGRAATQETLESQPGGQAGVPEPAPSVPRSMARWPTISNLRELARNHGVSQQVTPLRAVPRGDMSPLRRVGRRREQLNPGGRAATQETLESQPGGQAGVPEPAPSVPRSMARWPTISNLRELARNHGVSEPERRVTPLRAVPRGDNPRPPLRRVGRGREPLNPGGRAATEDTLENTHSFPGVTNSHT
jgi:hypothetical protein